MAITTDEQLSKAAADTRSMTLANMYLEMAKWTRCSRFALCLYDHNEASCDCPRAVWQQAARMAAKMVSDS